MIMLMINWLAVLLLAMPSLTTASNGDDLPTIPLDEPTTVTLDGEAAALFSFEAVAGTALTITARHDQSQPDDPLNDPVLAIRHAAFMLAYNHRHGTDDPDLAPQDARIGAFVPRVDGVYTLYVNTYGGIYAGDITVTLTTVDRFALTVDEGDDLTTITGTLPRGESYEYVFDGRAGDTLTITARSVGRAIDPVLYLHDDDGELVAWNDDHGGFDDLTLDVFDAQIRGVVLPRDGAYVVTVADFLGRGGAFALTIIDDAPE